MKRFWSLLCLLLVLTGLASEAQAEFFDITSADVDKDGWYTIAWNDTIGNGPFNVYYQYWNEAANEGQMSWLIGEAVRESRFQFTTLIPGASYRLIVRDSDGNFGYMIARIPGGEPFETSQKSKATVYLKYKTKPGKKDSDAKRDTKKSVAAMMKNMKKGYEYGLELRVKYTTKGKKTTRHNGVASICAPDGFIASQGVSQFPVSKRKGDTAYIRYVFPDFFRTLYAREEGIPTGQYTVKLYLDGQAFLETAFTLKK